MNEGRATVLTPVPCFLESKRLWGWSLCSRAELLGCNLYWLFPTWEGAELRKLYPYFVRGWGGGSGEAHWGSGVEDPGPNQPHRSSVMWKKFLPANASVSSTAK